MTRSTKCLRRTGILFRLFAATVFLVSIAIALAAIAQQNAPSASTPPSHTAHRAASHHRAAAHHGHHGGAAHRAHSAAHHAAGHHAARPTHSASKAQPSPAPAQPPVEAAAPTPAAAVPQQNAAAAAEATAAPAVEKAPEPAPAAAAAPPPESQPARQPAAIQPVVAEQPASAPPPPTQPAAAEQSSAPAQPAAIAPPAGQSPVPAAQNPSPAAAEQAVTPAAAPAQPAATAAPAEPEATPAAATPAAAASADQPTVTVQIDQQPAPAQPADPYSAQVSAAALAQQAAAEKAADEFVHGSTASEEDLRKMLIGKSLYLRGGYLDNNLTFGESGLLIGHSPQGSYTLSGIQIDKVHLSKHKLELEGARYGLHFLGAMPYEDPTKAVDRVKITPKKKFVKLTIDRELIVTPKKKKHKDGKDQAKEAKAPAGKPPSEASQSGPGGVVVSADSVQGKPAGNSTATVSDATPAGNSTEAGNPSTEDTAKDDAAKDSASANEPSEEEQAKAEMAAAPQEERPADPGSVTTTTSPAHAAKVLKDALDKIFAPGLDERMMAAMPDFWKRYYDAVAAKTDYRPKDPTVLRQSAVDKKARLLSKFVPESNDFAQDSGVAGMCLYHTVIGADGKPGEIAVARPIGFGLDENAVAAIRKASFEPAIKDGHPVPVVLDLVVQFRIYSKRTNVASNPDDRDKPQPTLLPGLYTLQDLMLRQRTQAQSPDPNQAQSQPTNQAQNPPQTQ